MQIYDWCVDLPDPYPYSDWMGAQEQRTQAPGQQVGDKVLDWGADSQDCWRTVRRSRMSECQRTVRKSRLLEFQRTVRRSNLPGLSGGANFQTAMRSQLSDCQEEPTNSLSENCQEESAVRLLEDCQDCQSVRGLSGGVSCQGCQPTFGLPDGTVKLLASICSSTTSTMFSEPSFMKTHTARHRHISMKDYPV